MSETEVRGRSSFTVLADIAAVARDAERRPKFREDPIGTVEGFDSLPEDVQSMFRRMGDSELAALGEMCEELVENGFSIELDRRKLCMF